MMQPLGAVQFKGHQCGRKNKYDKRKDANFALKVFTYLGQNKRKFIKELRCFLKFIISVRDGHCDYSYLAPKT